MQKLFPSSQSSIGHQRKFPWIAMLYNVKVFKLQQTCDIYKYLHTKEYSIYFHKEEMMRGCKSTIIKDFKISPYRTSGNNQHLNVEIKK